MTATEEVVAILTALGYKPELEITETSPVKDFFNVVTRMKDGGVRGVLVVNVGLSKPMQVRIRFRDHMTHEQLLMQLRIVLWCLKAEYGTIQPVARKTSCAPSIKLEYSEFDSKIELARAKLKYIRRRTRRIQKKYHGVEAKYMRMQRLNCHHELKKKSGISPERFLALEEKIQRLNNQFCHFFELQETLQTALESLIHEDASGRTLLQEFTDETARH